jgi:hypothetical protein
MTDQPPFGRAIQVFLQDNVLLTLTLAYIQLPLLVYFSSWLNGYAATACCLLLLYGNWQMARRYRLLDWSIRTPLAPRPVWFLASMLALLGWLLLSGVGGVGFQHADYSKHTAMLYDLVRMEWPMTLQPEVDSQRTFHVVYYVGWYLPAALVGKLFGFSAALAAGFGWTLLGLWLVLGWLFNFTGRVGPVVVLIFVLFSGLDFFGYVLVNQHFPAAADHLEWWAGLWQLSSMTSLLFWVPQHALAGWLMTFVFLQLLRTRRNEFLLFLLVPVLLWSPFVALGLLPLAVLGSLGTGWRRGVNLPNTAGSLVPGLIICAFLMSRLPERHAAFIPISSDSSVLFPMLGLFLALEVGLFVVLLYDDLSDLSSHFNRALCLALGFVALSLLFRYGLYNDLVMRASIPALFLLCLAMIRHFYLPVRARPVLDTLLVLVLLAGALNPMREIMHGIAAFDYPRYAPQPVVSLQPELARQYLASSDTLFFRYLADHAAPTPVAVSDELRRILRSGGELAP